MADKYFMRSGEVSQGCDGFGRWLSGFVDGEGCFQLKCALRRKGRPNYQAFFGIALRLDDKFILERIRDFLGCGYIRVYLRNDENGNDYVKYSVSSSLDLVNKVIPVFEKYPLLAKKSKDFEVWKDGVRLIYRAVFRPHGGGRVKSWSDKNMAWFTRCSDDLRIVRKYQDKNCVLGGSVTGEYVTGLVDGEGCFVLSCGTTAVGYKYRSARFCLQLRRDDFSILMGIKKFLGCGNVFIKKSRNDRHGDVVEYSVNKVDDLVTKVIPHFERFPLWTKKAKDFEVWRRGVELWHSVSQKPMKRIPDSPTGFLPKWTDIESGKFFKLCFALKESRIYVPEL